MDFPSRTKRLRAELKKLKLEAFFSCSFSNYFYLCGFSGSEGILLITPGVNHLFVDPRYFAQAKKEAKGVRIVKVSGRKEALDECSFVLDRMKCNAAGFEAMNVSVDLYKKLRIAFERVKLIPADNLLLDIRSVKEEREIHALQKAAGIADRVLWTVLKEIKGGISEKDIAAEIEYRVRKEGGEKASFAPIVLTGARTAFPHGRPTGRRLKKGELLLIDFGAVSNGYCSDITRTFVLGDLSVKQKRIFGLVLSAQKRAIERISDGVRCDKADGAARKVIADGGFRRNFEHGLGHGIGIEVHERPRLSQLSKEVLRSGMVVTVEPGVYLDGWGGVRIEDMAVVTKKGCRLLTGFPKDIIEI